MGRPSAHPNHPLVRLRATLSENSPIQVTRAVLAKRVGIPEPSLKDMEAGKYKMTFEVACRIAFATGVQPWSLFNGDNPLLDFSGRPFSKESGHIDCFLSPMEQETAKQLLEAMLEAAAEKRIAMLVMSSLNQWMLETIYTFNMQSLVSDKLTGRLGLFDPQYIPDPLRPDPKKKQADAQKWEVIEKEIDRVQRDLLDGGPVPTTSAEWLNLQFASREIVIKDVRRRYLEAVNQPAEKQSRSPKRKAA
jgi:DNA-binding XRE family transcriptional regulator